MIYEMIREVENSYSLPLEYQRTIVEILISLRDQMGKDHMTDDRTSIFELMHRLDEVQKIDDDKESYDDGYQKGRDDGYDDGHSNGRHDGYTDGVGAGKIEAENTFKLMIEAYRVELHMKSAMLEDILSVDSKPLSSLFGLESFD